MGLLKRTGNDERELSKALAKRGVAAQATVEAMSETGESRAGGTTRELEFRLLFTPQASAPVRVVVRQFMNDLALTGIAPGEPATITYDRDDPTRVAITGSPRYRIAEPGIPVRIPDPAHDDELKSERR